MAPVDLVREIGSGSFGHVYEISRQDVGGQYKAALKMICIPQSDSEMREIMSEEWMRKVPPSISGE